MKYLVCYTYNDGRSTSFGDAFATINAPDAGCFGLSVTAVQNMRSSIEKELKSMGRKNPNVVFTSITELPEGD